MDIEPLLPWFTFAALALSVGNSIWVIMMRGVRETAAKVTAQETKLTDHDRRIQAVEGELKHMPTKDEVHNLTVAMTEVSGRLETFDKELSGVARTVHRIEDYLRKDQ